MEVQSVESRTQRLRESWRRTLAVLQKEFLMLRRDRVTLASMIIIPLTLMLLFGYALNNTPHDLPTAWVASEDSDIGWELRSALEKTGFFRITHSSRTTEEIDHWIKSGAVTIVIEVPSGFERRLRRGEHPTVIVLADASNPVEMAIALASLDGVKATALKRIRGLPVEVNNGADFELRVHRRYNPTGSTRLYIVPGLFGIILNITMLFYTALAVTREFERGTMEGLLAMPIRPIEIMLGKMAPYVVVGIGQAILIIGVAYFIFQVPIVGSLALLGAATLLFIMTNLAFGYTFSTISQNQLQAVQMTIMFFLPNLMLAGIVFPYSGMPRWAQIVSECLPLTHFTRIAGGIMLKGSDIFAIAYDSAALGAAMMVAMFVAAIRFKRTLD